MNELTFKQKAQALDALCEGELSLHLDCHGNWYTGLGHVEIKDGSCLQSTTGDHASTPQEALENTWKLVTNLPNKQYLVRNAYDKKKRRAFRWNGFMWAEVQEQLA